MTTPTVKTVKRGGSRFYIHPETGDQALVRLLSTNRPPQSVKSPVHSPNELWNAFGACGGRLGVNCHSRLPTNSNSSQTGIGESAGS